MRTTVNIDEPILKEVKALQAEERKSLGRLISDLLALALEVRSSRRGSDRADLCWTSRSMGARVDLADADALYDAMDEEPTS